MILEDDLNPISAIIDLLSGAFLPVSMWLGISTSIIEVKGLNEEFITSFADL